MSPQIVRDPIAPTFWATDGLENIDRVGHILDLAQIWVCGGMVLTPFCAIFGRINLILEIFVY